MPIIKFTTNTTEIHKFANRLEKLGRVHFPIVVRQTINSASFGMKKTTLPNEWKNKGFEKRPTKDVIIPATKAVYSKGSLNIKTMQSSVQLNQLPRSKSAVNDIKKHEEGKGINQNFVALTSARIGNVWNKNVKSQYRWGNIKSQIPPRIRNNKSKFKREAYRASKSNGLIYYKNWIAKVDSIDKKGKVKLTFLYKKIDKPFTPNKTGFFKKAGEIEQKKMDSYFVKNAKARIEKVMSK